MGTRLNNRATAGKAAVPFNGVEFSCRCLGRGQLTKKGGLRTIRLHDVRHTALTLMALNGVPLAVVAAWAGHADLAFTLPVYAHSQDDAIRSASSLLTRMISEAL